MCSLCSRLRRGVLYRVARRTRRDQDRARPPPRRHPRDVLPQPVLRRQAEDDAAEARVRRRPARGDPAARVRARARPRPLRRPDGVPDHPVQPVRLAGAPAAQAGERDAARLGEELSRPHRVGLQRARQGRAVAPHGPLAVRFRARCARPAAPNPTATSASTSTRRSSARPMPHAAPQRRRRPLRCGGDARASRSCARRAAHRDRGRGDRVRAAPLPAAARAVGGTRRRSFRARSCSRRCSAAATSSISATRPPISARTTSG